MAYKYKPKIDWTKPTAQFLGRFQPWNEGHRAVFDALMIKGNALTPDPYRTSRAQQCLIMVRQMPLDEDNPLTFKEVKQIINDDLKLEYHNKYEIIKVPNITNVFYGRTVGFNVERIQLPEKLESLDTKKIRAEEQHFNRKFWAGRE